MGIDTAQAQIATRTNKLNSQSGCPLDEPRPFATVLSARSTDDRYELPRFLHLSAAGTSRGHFVSRSPAHLHLHPAVVRMNLASWLVEITAAMDGRSLAEPILITTTGTIISGFGGWQAALSDTRATLDCIEYPLNDEQALELILINHRPRHFLNGFSRIRLALELEPYFHAKATANQSYGGKHKGSANLPKAVCIEARQEVARLAGVSARNVRNVKTILEKAHPRLVDALHAGTLSIHRAVQLCTLPRGQQVDQFIRIKVEGATSRVTRQAIARLRTQGLRQNPGAVLKALQEHEMREPGSIVVRAGDRQETVILLGRDLLADLRSQAEPTLT